MFFSVVIPTYNRVEFISATIESVLAQSFKDYEIIIIDDGSTDNTLDVLNKSFSDTKIKIITQVNSERGAARNNGFNHASGRYVVFLDSDDIMLKNHLQILYDAIHEKRFPDFLTTKFNFLRNGRQYASKLSSYKAGFYDYKLFLDGNHIACNVCVKKGNEHLHLFEQDRKYSVMEDWMFVVQNLRYNKIYLADSVTLLINDHETRSMRQDHGIVNKIWLAVEWMLRNNNLTNKDERMLNAHANYLSAIHHNLFNHKIMALQFLIRSLKLAGFQIKHLKLFLNILFGNVIRQAINRK